MNKLVLYFGFVMTTVYCALGAYFIFFGNELFAMPPWARIAAGCLLIAYGLFRFYRYRNMADEP